MNELFDFLGVFPANFFKAAFEISLILIVPVFVIYYLRLKKKKNQD